jgi:fluoroacetyl-CoA thioesterase
VSVKTGSSVTIKMAAHAEIEHVIEVQDTAIAHRTGDVPVLATPRVVGLCEEAAVAAIDALLTASQTSVGCRIEVAHVAPVAIGSKVRASATLERTEGRRLVFNVSVTDASGLVAAGKVTRVVVDREIFVRNAR